MSKGYRLSDAVFRGELERVSNAVRWAEAALYRAADEGQSESALSSLDAALANLHRIVGATFLCELEDESESLASRYGLGQGEAPGA